MDIKNSTFIVSGGGSGLGAATVRRLVTAGGRVVIADINEKQGEALAAELGAVARFVRTDVADSAQCESAVNHAVAEFGGLHGLVNCAGIAVAEKVLGRDGVHKLESFERCIRVNLVGLFNLLRLSVAAMSKQASLPSGERGVVVNTASVAAYDGQIGQAAYSASKGGLVAMTLPIARELAQHGIRVMTIAPGIFHTPMMDSLPPAAQESLGKMVPFPPRLGRPDEYAALVQHIVENEMLNGEVIRLDGAIRMAPK